MGREMAMKRTSKEKFEVGNGDDRCIFGSYASAEARITLDRLEKLSRRRSCRRLNPIER